MIDGGRVRVGVEAGIFVGGMLKEASAYLGKTVICCGDHPEHLANLLWTFVGLVPLGLRRNWNARCLPFGTPFTSAAINPDLSICVVV
jgi:hypothetical protein